MDGGGEATEKQTKESYEFSVPGEHIVEALYTVIPKEGERYFICVLLHHITSAESFNGMRKMFWTVYAIPRGLRKARYLI